MQGTAVATANISSTTATATKTITGFTGGHLLTVDTGTGVKSTASGVEAVLSGCTDGTNTLTIPTASSYATGGSNPLAGNPLSFASPTDTGNMGVAYIVEPSSGSVTITCTWHSTGGLRLFYWYVAAQEFSCSPNCTGVTAKGAKAVSYGTNTGAVPIVTPCITPSAPGDLLWGTWITDLGAQNGANSPWTTVSASNEEAYILSAPSGSTCANFKDTQSGTDSLGATILDLD